jgi:hypothetical protein
LGGGVFLEELAQPERAGRAMQTQNPNAKLDSNPAKDPVFEGIGGAGVEKSVDFMILLSIAAGKT